MYKTVQRINKLDSLSSFSMHYSICNMQDAMFNIQFSIFDLHFFNFQCFFVAIDKAIRKRASLIIFCSGNSH